MVSYAIVAPKKTQFAENKLKIACFLAADKLDNDFWRGKEMFCVNGILGCLSGFRNALIVSVMAIAGMIAAEESKASYVLGFEVEINTSNQSMAFHNISTATMGEDVSISNIMVDLGANHFNTPPAPTEKTGMQMFGASNTTVALSTSANVGYTGSLGTDIVDNASMASFSFTQPNFASGKAWGVNVDMLDGADDQIRGAEMNGASVKVTFGALGSLTFTYANMTGNGTSFPGSITSVPEPTSIGMFCMFGLGGYFYRRRVLKAKK